VESDFPIVDAATIGHKVPFSRAYLEKKEAALRRRFKRVSTDGDDAAESNQDQGLRTAQRLAHLKWVCDSVAEDIVVLLAQKDHYGCRDRVLIPALEHLGAMAELSTGVVTTPDTWRVALNALHEHAALLIVNCSTDAALITDMELVLERISLVERRVATAVRVYIGYITTK